MTSKTIEMENKKELLICECYSTEHQIVVYYSRDDESSSNNNMVYLHIHLNKRPFWGRLVYGLKYIFGHQCRFGAFDEFIFNPKDADKLQSVVNYLKENR